MRFPFTMRVEVETDLKLPIPPPMLSIPPMEEEKEVKSTKKNTSLGKKGRLSCYFDGCLQSLSLSWLPVSESKNKRSDILWMALTVCSFLPPADGKEKKRLGPRWDEPPKGVKSSKKQKICF